jgi:hypothetical protein
VTPQQKRRLTLAINAYGRARSNVGNFLTKSNKFVVPPKFIGYAEKAKAHLVAVVEKLCAEHRPRANHRRCTCPAAVDITFTGHLPDCPANE